MISRDQLWTVKLTDPSGRVAPISICTVGALRFVFRNTPDAKISWRQDLLEFVKSDLEDTVVIEISEDGVRIQ